MTIAEQYPFPWSIKKHKTCYSLCDASGYQVVFTTRRWESKDVAEYILGLVQADLNRTVNTDLIGAEAMEEKP